MKQVSEEEIRSIVRDEIGNSRSLSIGKVFIALLLFSLIVAIPAFANVNIRDAGNLVLHDGTKLNMSDNRIINVKDPVSSQDAATMKWVNNKNYATENYVDSQSSNYDIKYVEYSEVIQDGASGDVLNTLSSVSGYNPSRDKLLEFLGESTTTSDCTRTTFIDINYVDGDSKTYLNRNDQSVGIIKLQSDSPISEVELKGSNNCGYDIPMSWKFAYLDM